MNNTPNTADIDGGVLLQQIEDFCGKLDRFVEEEKQNKNDLQEQVIVFLDFLFLCFCFMLIVGRYPKELASY